MGLNLDFIDGQTSLDEEEKEGLLIKTIATRGELDEFRTGCVVVAKPCFQSRSCIHRRFYTWAPQAYV